MKTGALVPNASIIPASDSAVDLGASTPKYFANAYADKVHTPAVAFPATQIADADANTLDDYEEGTWTAVLTCGTSGTITLDSSYNLCSYTKVGRLVTVTGGLIVSSVSSPVGSLIMSLPITVGTTSELASRFSGVVMFSGLGSALGSGSPLVILGGEGAVIISILEQTTTIYDNTVANHIQGTTQLFFSFSYIAAT